MFIYQRVVLFLWAMTQTSNTAMIPKRHITYHDSLDKKVLALGRTWAPFLLSVTSKVKECLENGWDQRRNGKKPMMLGQTPLDMDMGQGQE